MWNRPAPPGFQGLRDDLPMRVYQRGLPHWRQQGATYFVTFRLADSLPQARLRELAGLRSELLHSPPKSPAAEQLARDIIRRVERWLDEGQGSCLLRCRSMSDIVARTLAFFDGQRFELGCFVVMPNHVHAIVRPFDDATMPLERILQTWKRQSSSEIKLLMRSPRFRSPDCIAGAENMAMRPDYNPGYDGGGGAVWQEESFDRIVRDEEHLHRAIAYVGDNPARAGLAWEDCLRWIRPGWSKLGWGFPDR